MPHPKKTNRFPEVQEMLNRAMDSERGIRIPMESKSQAFSIKMKIFAKKKDWREAYIKMYEDDPENPERHRDPFQLIHPEIHQDEAGGRWYLYIHKQDPFSNQFMIQAEEL